MIDIFLPVKQSLLRPILILSIIFLFTTATAQAQNGWRAKVDPLLIAEMNTHETVEFLAVLSNQVDIRDAATVTDKVERGRLIYDTLTTHAEQTQNPIRAVLDAHGATYRTYWVANLIWVRGSKELVRSIAQRPDIKAIYASTWQQMDLPSPDAPPPSGRQSDGIEWNISLVGAPAVWAEGFVGQGAIIGGQDTGYDWTHPAIQASYRGWDGVIADHNYNWHDAIHENNPATPPGNPCGFSSPIPCDDNYHGTHTMGTMVGDDRQGKQIGMAPGAQWIGCRNMEEGWGTPATYIECYEWFIAPYPFGGNSFTDGDPSKAPDVINNSWSCPPSEGCIAADILAQVVDNVRAAGILTVHSAGNSGGAGCSTVTTPAAIYGSSFTVGSTSQDDRISFFSSRGPVTIDGSNRQKPNIVAPGEGILSSVPGNDYFYLSGTSMAAPHVAGLAALLISSNPALSGQVDRLEEIITQSAFPLVTNEGCGGDTETAIPNNTYGWGRIDALTAYQAARPIFENHTAFFPLLLVLDE